jgi:long-chain acyl-CoA synthetase
MVEDAERNPSSEITPQGLALLIYTSGTTGFPKGVMLSHANLCSNVISSLQALELNSNDKVLLILPMFHSFTLTVCILIPIYIGAKIAVIKSVKPFHKVLRSILLNRITIVVGIPHLYDIFKNINIPKIIDIFLRIRVCISGAAPLSPNTLEIFKQKFKKFMLLEGYGLTETSPVVSINPLRGVQKPGSIGLPIPGVEVKVVREDESEAEFEEVGELIVKGPNVMMGYYNNPRETEKTIKGEWLFTGDMAKIDTEGYIYIVGRKKEMILMHGMNVYPSEIENIIQAHPKVKEVAVVGKKDKAKGEAPVAFIALHDKTDAQEGEIIGFCKGKLAGYKIPHLIEFRESLPKTPTGKVLKRQLKEEVN